MNGGLPLFVGPGAGAETATGAPALDPAPNPVGAMPSGSVLLVTAVPLRRRAGRISLDDQTCDGLERWGQHFDRVVYAGIEEQPGREEGSSTTWREIRDLTCADRITMVPLPNAYRVQDFSTHYGRTRALLGEMIGRSRYLCFTLGALVGDWGGVAALEAMAQRRDYAVWFDRVEHEVVRRTLGSMRLRRRVKEYVGLPLMVRYHRHLIRRSALGLFQGQDCFQAYAAHARRPFCVYDTHLMPEDMIGAADLAAKCAAIEGGDPLRLVYVGRASAMKGPFDWLDTVAGARRAGVRLTATWFGDGPLLDEMRAGIAARGLADCVTLAGFEGDRSRLLRAMRDAHLFLFCHTTPESPRCLLEALACGTPLVGYGSPYSEDIAGREGAGVLGPMRDPEALAQLVVGLDRRRAALADLVRAAARVGRRFDAAALYGRRADLLKRYL